MSRRKSVKSGKNLGMRYEDEIISILKKRGFCPAGFVAGGGSVNPDSAFIHSGSSYSLEIKADLSADFAQIELRWEKTKGFFCSTKSKHQIFADFLTHQTDFIDKINDMWRGRPRKFAVQSHTDHDRLSDLDNFPDIKEQVGTIFVERFYTWKNPPVHYIQIGKWGFYHMDKDFAGLNVPRLEGEAILRARVKTRSKSRCKWGFLIAIKVRKLRKSTFDIEEQDGRLFPPIQP